ncbi:hypothetical protein H6P81_013389 [Aristolochia fimbriata]|uniref:DUF4216 domain-containing protein n=1 Tax=Aristolochia fimbriata TaxID=158543 RepID=A0AAV7EFR9_ARIFI|nr:hypothetical protein H6P81_013389 [Aristolochia fimbriata]
MEEVTTFCARYMDGVESKLNRPVLYEEGPIGAKVSRLISANEAHQAHHFVLFNSPSIETLRMNENISEEIICLARGPKYNVASYHGFFVNGYKFETIIVDHLRVTRNSGVASIGEEKKIFYGVVENVLEVYFRTLAPVHLLKCSCYDMKEGSRRVVDEYNFTLVNTTKKSFEDEPFIYPSQAQQVFYS